MKTQRKTQDSHLRPQETAGRTFRGSDPFKQGIDKTSTNQNNALGSLPPQERWFVLSPMPSRSAGLEGFGKREIPSYTHPEYDGPELEFDWDTFDPHTKGYRAQKCAWHGQNGGGRLLGIRSRRL